MGQREHPADLVRLHPHARRGRASTEATRIAMLNANYLKARLEPHYPVLYAGKQGRVAHELIFDLRPFKQRTGIDETGRRQAADGLRLPRADGVVPGAGHADGRADRERADRGAGSLLRRDDRDPRARSRPSPTARPIRRTTCSRTRRTRPRTCTADDWPHAYSREQAAYPVPDAAPPQVLAAGLAHRQPVRRSQPDVRLSADRGVRRATDDEQLTMEQPVLRGRRHRSAVASGYLRARRRGTLQRAAAA